MSLAASILLSVVSFGSPKLLFLLILLPVGVALYLLAEGRRERGAAAWSAPRLLPNMVGRPGSLRRVVPPVLFLLALTLLLVGFARPQRRETEVKPGATIVFALDQSGSMASNDVPPSRLLAADGLISSFVKTLPSTYKVALVTFAASYQVRVPPTFDHAVLLDALPANPLQQGTAIGDAIQGAITTAALAVGGTTAGGPRPPAEVVLFSDGGQNDGGLTESQVIGIAKKADIPVSTVVLGTPGGEVNQSYKVKGSSQSYVETLRVPVEPAYLKTLAAGTGGVYFQGGADLSVLTSQLRGHLLHDRELREITVVITGAGLALMALAAVLSGLWFRRFV